MKNNSKAAAKRTQAVYSEPQFIKVGSKEKTCKSGAVITVNRYRKNPNAKVIKMVLHPLIPADGSNPGFNQFKKFKGR